MVSRMRLVLALVYALGVSGIGGALASGPLVKLANGSTVEGVSISIDGAKVSSFIGLRYAVAPANDLRWQPPISFTASSGKLDAKSFGPPCPQQDRTQRKDSDPTIDVMGDEDCLFLNVWTPASEVTGELPVLVWIHGGGFVRGATSDPRFNGAWLASQGIVVVTISYRLGVMSAPPPLRAVLNEDYHVNSVNFGLLDQVLALEWVKENIAVFGGDPAQVTVAGSSAGGASVGYLVTNPAIMKAKLFSKAIMMSSGGADRKPNYKIAEGLLPQQFQKQWQSVLDRLDHKMICSSSSLPEIKADMTLKVAMASQGVPKALRHCVTASDLVAAFGNSWNNAGKLVTQEYRSYPFHDGETVTDASQVDGFKVNRVAGLPVMIGFARDEATEVDSRGRVLRKKGLVRRLKRKGIGSVRKWNDIVGLYPDADGSVALPRRVYADVTYHWPAQIIACLQSKTESNVFVYEFNYTSPQRKRNPDAGAGHSEDAGWLFGGPILASSLGSREGQVDERDRAFVSRFVGAILNFVKSADPTQADMKWEPYMPGMNVMIISNPSFEMLSNYDAPRLKAIQAMSRNYGVDFNQDGCNP